MCLTIAVMFVMDLLQTKDAIRRNYPLIGRFRYVFSSLGEFFRQYFFAMDREEMPFNRAEREWIEHAGDDKNMTIAFGSTKNLTSAGTFIFVNCPYPTLEVDVVPTLPMVIGPLSKTPYTAHSLMNISGMSFGAISKPAVKALSMGAKKANCWINTGEGGLSRYHLESGADIVYQIGTAKYGVRNEEGGICDKKLRDLAARPQVKMFEIKLSQGAKPGKGGILPAVKVTQEIATIRGIPVGKASISPNRHPEINSCAELLNFIDRVREVTKKPVGFKLVIGSYEWLEELCALIRQRGEASAPDFITLDGGDGGTGAAPMALMDNVGLTIKESLPLLVDTLIRNGFRERIKVIASGKLITPSEVAWAIAAGADFVTSARGFMFSLGCIQALKCNKNTCPTGITTHNRRLQLGLNPNEKSIKVANYCQHIIHEVETIAHSCGVSHPRQLQRKHVRIVQNDARSVLMSELFPMPTSQHHQAS
ncbi:MAG: FMN-binding glutamate synthase family protein [Pseudomonadota bacterium]